MSYVQNRKSSDKGFPSNLFGWPDLEPARYPQVPGCKAPGTSREAAQAISSHATGLRKAALQILASVHPNGLSADQVAKNAGASVLAMRPRISELRALGQVYSTGDKVPNDSGIDATVWVISPAGFLELEGGR